MSPKGMKKGALSLVFLQSCVSGVLIRSSAVAPDFPGWSVPTIDPELCVDDTEVPLKGLETAYSRWGSADEEMRDWLQLLVDSNTSSSSESRFLVEDFHFANSWPESLAKGGKNNAYV